MKTGIPCGRFACLMVHLCPVVLWLSCAANSGVRESDTGPTDLGTTDVVTDVPDRECSGGDVCPELGLDLGPDENGADVIPDVDLAETIDQLSEPHPFYCGDGHCSWPEDCATCPSDCGCSLCGETCVDGECVFLECLGWECGDDGCGGSCGTCPEGMECNDEFLGVCREVCDPFAQFLVGDLVQRIHFMEIPAQGHPGDGLDLDNDPDTCAPSYGECSEGIDNKLGRFVHEIRSWIGLNAMLSRAIQDGLRLPLIDAHGWNVNGSPFFLHVYRGKSEQPDCDLTTDLCEFSVLLDSFDPETCAPTTTILNASFDGQILTAGGLDQEMTVWVDGAFLSMHDPEGPENYGPVMPLTLHRVHLVAEVHGQGIDMTWNGVWAGAIRKLDIMNLIDNLPPNWDLPASGKIFVQSPWNILLRPDIDLDGDGEAESLSVGIRFATVSAHIQGSSDLCEGKECGSNGYGGSCGTCSEGFTCSVHGQCFLPEN